jgi:thioester reductase-like protein
MTTYLVTGATGFLGRHLVERLLSREDADVRVLVRSGSQQRLAARAADWPSSHRMTPVVGDLTKPQLGLSKGARGHLAGSVDHLVHLAALYDMTAGDELNQRTNVDGTRHVVGLANELGVGCLHHVSSVAVAGHHPGVFTERDFDLGQ